MENCFAFIKVTQCFSDFQRSAFFSYNHIGTYWNIFSIIVGILTVLSYSFLSCLLFYPCQKGRLQFRRQIHFSIFLVYLKMKAPYECSLTYFTNHFFYQRLPRFCWRKVIHLKHFNEIYKLSITSAINVEKCICMRNAVLYAAVVISMMNFLGGENRFI